MGTLKAGSNVVVTEDKQKKNRKIEKLTILNEDSKETIFNLIFAESDGSSRKQ